MKEAPASSADGPVGATLAETLAETFDATLDDAGFAMRLARLAATLTNARTAAILAGDTILANSSPARLPEAAAALAHDIIAGDPCHPARARGDLAGIGIVLPSDEMAALLIQLPQAGSVAGALALERLTGLSALARANFRNEEAQGLRKLAAAMTAEPTDLESIAAHLRHATDADMAAIGRIASGSVRDLAISGQPTANSRAALPDQLRFDLTEAAQRPVPAAGDAVAEGRAGIVVVRLERARRNAAMGQLAAATLATGSGIAVARGNRRLRRAGRWLASFVVLVGIAFLPLPDGRRISAEVAAVQERVITAPFSAALAEVAVRENDRVTQGETLLARLETGEIAQDLIAAQAEHAKAILDREAARADRDPTALRSAELEGERLRTRIALLEARLESARILAPIDGVVAGEGLGELQGATVRQGEPIMRILNPSALRLNLQITDRDVGDLAGDATGIFRPDFDPARSYPARITTISPALSERDDIAVFLGEAAFDGPTEALAPGLRGVLAVEREWRPIWQIVRDGIRNWVLLRIWI